MKAAIPGCAQCPATALLPPALLVQTLQRIREVIQSCSARLLEGVRMNSLQLARITLRSPQHHRPVPQMMKVNGHARHLLTFFDAPCIMLDNVIQQRRPATKPLEAAHIPTVASLAYLRHERIAARPAPCRMEKHVEIIGIPGAQEKEPPRRIH